jgi:hypothetical protein
VRCSDALSLGEEVKQLNCVDAHGANLTFVYERCAGQYSPNTSETWTYRVRCNPGDTHSFEMSLEEVDSNTVQIIMMIHYDRPEYAAKGIPDALIAAVATDLNKTVVSSPTRGRMNVSRNEKATKVWDRLVAAGRATYDKTADVYTYLP